MVIDKYCKGCIYKPMCGKLSRAFIVCKPIVACNRRVLPELIASDSNFCAYCVHGPSMESCTMNCDKYELDEFVGKELYDHGV